jgi:hypothetical protein
VDKVCIGIPSYGTQTHDFFKPLALLTAYLYKDNIDLVDLICVAGMSADFARNETVKQFLATDAEWLQWIDADNTHPIGALRRMLDTGRKMITGVYVKRYGKPEPIMYIRNTDGTYTVFGDYRRGEIVPIDAAGMGGCLVHRSVFEDIQKDYRILTRVSGGTMTIHKNDIQGDIFDASAPTDGKVIGGVLQERLRLPTIKLDFPFFMIEHGRTEDYDFFEKAKRVGHQLFVDTSIEIPHIFTDMRKVSEWREWKREHA